MASLTEKHPVQYFVGGLSEDDAFRLAAAAKAILQDPDFMDAVGLEQPWTREWPGSVVPRFEIVGDGETCPVTGEHTFAGCGLQCHVPDVDVPTIAAVLFCLQAQPADAEPDSDSRDDSQDDSQDDWRAHLEEQQSGF